MTQNSAISTTHASLHDAPYYVKALAMALPAIMLGWQISGWIFFLPSAMQGRADFRQLYTAGYMVRTGHARELYDYDAQKRFQDAVASPMYLREMGTLVPIALPFIRPAYQALFFYPFSFFSYRAAYFLFLTVNLGLLGATFLMLRPWLTTLAAVWNLLPLAMFISFIPTGVALMQGQDSGLLLLLLSASLLRLKHDSEFWSGVLAGFALFKLQIAIPIAALFFCWRRWRFFGGFCVTGTALALLSVWITGLEQAKTYVRSLLSMQTGINSDPNQFQFLVPVKKMMNLHGLTYGIAEPHIGLRSTTLVTLILSAVCFFWIAFVGFKLRRDDQFKVAIGSAVLVSYYIFVHDLVILLIPLSLVLNETLSSGGKKAWLTIIGAGLFLAPALVSSAYLFSILLCLFVFLCVKNAAARPATTTAD